MKSQIDKLNEWVAVPPFDDGIVMGQETPIGFMTREMLAVTLEFDDPDNMVCTMCRYDMYLGLPAEIAMEAGNTGAAIPTVGIILPGMCGHYRCGGTVTVCLN